MSQKAIKQEQVRGGSWVCVSRYVLPRVVTSQGRWAKCRDGRREGWKEGGGERGREGQRE